MAAGLLVSACFRDAGPNAGTETSAASVTSPSTAISSSGGEATESASDAMSDTGSGTASTDAPATDSLTTDPVDTTGSTTTPGTSESPSTGEGTITTTDEPATTTTTTTTTTTIDPSTGTTGEKDVCAPDDGDSQCQHCVKDFCCEAYTACLEQAACACFLDCTVDGGSPPACLDACNADENQIFGITPCLFEICGNVCYD